MTVDLHFVGLFCHASYGGKEIVVAPFGPRDHPHEFRIIVPKIRVIQSNSAEDGLFASAYDTEYSYRDVASKISISGVNAGSRTTTTRFDDHTPRLTLVSEHKLVSDELRTQTPGQFVNTFFEHPGGALDAIKVFHDEAKFAPPTSGWPNPKCITAVSSVVLATDGVSNIRLASGDKYIELSSKVATITFVNLPRDETGFHLDFSHYYRALFKDDALESYPQSNNTDCRCEDCEFWRVNNVECSNSQYP